MNRVMEASVPQNITHQFTQTFTPEAKLLLLCIPSSFDVQKANQLIDDGIKWDYLLRMAYRHNVVPTLYTCLNKTQSDKIPPDTLKELRDVFMFTIQRNLYLTSELVKLIDLLKANEIDVLPYKGPALSMTAFSDLTSRVFGDLDLILHKKDILKAKSLLAEHGFYPLENYTPSQEKALLELNHAYELHRKKGEVTIELHWQITDTYFDSPLKPDDLWKSLGEVELGNKKVDDLSLENMLIVLCIHGGWHRWVGLKWVYDIVGILHQHAEIIRWDKVIEIADNLKSRRILLLGLLMATRIADVALPASITELLSEDEEVKALADEAYSKLFIDTDKPLDDPEASRFFRFHYRLQSGIWNRLRYTVICVMTPTVEDWTAIQIPDRFTFLYYVFRPIRLMSKYLRRLMPNYKKAQLNI